MKSLSMDGMPSMPMPTTMATFPSLTNFSSSAGAESTPESEFSPSGLMNNIDPSLVASAPIPASSATQQQQQQPQRHTPSDDESSDSEDEEEIVKPVKVGGKGKGRKGTVASGGVVKRTGAAATSAMKEKAAQIAKEKAADDDWRPSPEEYKKMTSKEKRQLRNKISARNFRVRRKGESKDQNLFPNFSV